MATVPNRYYNSPFIRDAAANLASALAPPDPEKQLAAQREQWKFERLQELSQIEDEDRLNAQAGDDAIAALLADAGTQPAAPTSPGQAAFFSANPGAAGPAGMDAATFQKNIRAALKGGRGLGDVVTAAGPRGSAYAAKSGMLDDKQLAALQLQLLRGDQSMGRTQVGVGGRWDVATLNDDRIRDLAKDNEALRLRLAEIEGAQGREHDASVTARTPAGGAPLDVSPVDSVNLGYNLEDWAARQTGNDKFQLPPKVFDAARTYANKIYGETRNADTALSKSIEKFFGPNPAATQDYDSWFFDPFHADTEAGISLRGGKTVEQIVAEIAAEEAAARQPQTLGGAATGTQPSTAGTPPLLARPGADETPPVPVNTPEEAMRLPPNTRFIIASGPNAGEIRRTPPQ